MEKCRSNCPGPENCPFGGALYYQPENDVYGPYYFKCEIYERWIKQVELERKVMDTIPKKFWDKRFANFQALSEDLTMALSAARKYAEKEAWTKGANLIILGGYGTGKTHLAAAITRKAIEKGYTAVFLTASSLVLGSIEEIQEKFRIIRDTDLVVIDDFSNEIEHKLALQEIFQLINYRYEAEKGMVITSNLNPAKLKEVLGDRIFDRIVERSVIVHIKDAESYRWKKRRKYLEWLED
ncbi:MAG: ATP-binding protein [Candidatus Syntropharchaeia archaeon]